MIQRHLPQYEASIHGIVTSATSHQDRRSWLFDKTGEYTTKSGYNLAVTAKAERRDHPLDWQKCIWSIKTSPKIKDFLWRVARKAIPVSANLATRGLPTFPCKLCGGIEDDLHTFLLCPLAQELGTLLLGGVELRESSRDRHKRSTLTSRKQEDISTRLLRPRP
ncbi:hypothetical protein Bca52824_080256 [Brassica carinata]|uniref:Reverse transcriptase zinc-binding domain-containing protein n=1 Tax=Brassica carinata TaxID=52824 RepID=A0A8X7Q0T3_BRACI|nr:hypothetical protein Bca52824_080256 [Brassica carinata]